MNMFSGDRAKKVGQFFKKNGFYIALGLCVVALAVAAVLTFGGGSEEAPLPEVETAQVESLHDTTVGEEIAERNAAMTTASGTSAVASPQPSPSKPPVKYAPTVKLTRPMAGEIVRAASIDKLIFNRTLGQWATHNGVDFSGKQGDTVKAALSGTVTAIYESGAMGDCIVVDSGASGKILYAGVAPAAGLAVDSKLNSGDALGTLTSVPFEGSVGTHLHMEYTVGGKYVDPAPYFTE